MGHSRDLGIIVTSCEVASIYLSDRVGPKFTMAQLIGETMAFAAPADLLEPEDIRIVLKHMGLFETLRKRYSQGG